MSRRPGKMLERSGSLPFLKFYIDDHCSDPALSICSLTAQGFQVHMLRLMHRGNPYGMLANNGAALPMKAIARAAGTTEKNAKKLLEELISAGVFSKNSDNFVFSRRLIRDRKKLEKNVADGRMGQKNSENIFSFDESQESFPTHEVDPQVNHGANQGVNPEAEAEAEAEADISPSIPQANVSGTPSAPVRGRTENSAADDDGFSSFWAEYPAEARSAPDYARKAYAKALQLGATPERILAALRRDMERAGNRHPLAPAAWLKGGSWRLEDGRDESPPRGNVAPIDRRFDGWENADHMELAKWRSARECGWRTKSADHNALDEDTRHQALWDHLTGYRPRVARFLAQHEPDGIPLEVAS